MNWGRFPHTERNKKQNSNVIGVMHRPGIDFTARAWFWSRLRPDWGAPYGLSSRIRVRFSVHSMGHWGACYSLSSRRSILPVKAAPRAECPSPDLERSTRVLGNGKKTGVKNEDGAARRRLIVGERLSAPTARVFVSSGQNWFYLARFPATGEGDRVCVSPPAKATTASRNRKLNVKPRNANAVSECTRSICMTPPPCRGAHHQEGNVALPKSDLEEFAVAIRQHEIHRRGINVRLAAPRQDRKAIPHRRASGDHLRGPPRRADSHSPWRWGARPPPPARVCPKVGHASPQIALAWRQSPESAVSYE